MVFAGPALRLHVCLGQGILLQPYSVAIMWLRMINKCVYIYIYLYWGNVGVMEKNMEATIV